MKKQIEQLILESLKTLNLPETNFTVEHPQIESHGDYASNVAMVLFPQLKKQGIDNYKSPRDLAKAIAHQLEVSSPQLVVSIEVAGPGFINFRLNQDVFLSELTTILETKDEYGKSNVNKDVNVVIEFTDPNPFKELHIGHLYSNIVGETISRLFESTSASVWRADYFGDVGMHVAKSIWGLEQKFESDKTSIEEMSTWELNEKVKYLGQAYAKGATAFEEDNTAKEEIKHLNFVVYVVAQEMWREQGWEIKIDYKKFTIINPEELERVGKLYRLGRTWSLEYFDHIYDRLGTSFNGYYPESKVGEVGYQLVLENLEKGIFERSNGAVVFPGEKHGLHTRVFINQLGLPTYEAKELGLAPTKYQDFPYDKSLIITGNEVNDYFKVLLKALTLINPDLGNKTEHLGHGMVKLPEGKMSSRTGKVITGEWLLNEAQSAAKELLHDKNSKVVDQDNAADTIGQAAIRYALLKTSFGKDVIFDFKESVSFEGNSGPYLQYTYARCSSVISKAGGIAQNSSPDSRSLNDEEQSLLRWLTRYQEEIISATQTKSPHIVCDYAYELAARFNTFYNSHSILGNEQHPVEEQTKQLRLTLTKATKQVLKNALYILGIHTLEQM